MLLLGPPGAGTSMLAHRLPTILPAVTLPKALDTTRVHRVAGRTGDRAALVTTRPFRAPHHTISDVGLIGGGPVPMSGDVSLAHHGVRFLDELPECRRHVLEVLRQSLEEGIVTIARVPLTMILPASLILVEPSGILQSYNNSEPIQFHKFARMAKHIIDSTES
jgi:magnesium chelatase family protein